MLARQRDVTLLFTTRIVRLFAYGFLSVILVLYLAAIGFEAQAIGLLLTLTLAGDALVTLWITTAADRVGRRRMLLVGAGLMVLSGLVFLWTHNPILLIGAAIIGVISPSGGEIGPFLSIEQAALAQLVSDQQRTHFFAWYNLAGSFATAAGALAGGWLAQNLQSAGLTQEAAYRVILLGYAAAGLLLIALFLALSAKIEATNASSTKRVLGLHDSKQVVFKLSALFALDAFAGGLVLQSIMAYWFHVRFGLQEGLLGTIFFAANILAGISALLAVRLAAKFGLINTMVFTHIPSNIMLRLVPLMPTLPL
ncbi:MAG TPA: MFS transporter, partial [Caldilineaceae bacterium]|nr:MFS transporter [Caldilineaceae bacterium]